MITAMKINLLGKLRNPARWPWRPWVALRSCCSAARNNPVKFSPTPPLPGRGGVFHKKIIFIHLKHASGNGMLFE